MSDPGPRWRRYLRFWRADVRADVDDELAFHLDMRRRDLEARGLADDVARDEADVDSLCRRCARHLRHDR